MFAANSNVAKVLTRLFILFGFVAMCLPLESMAQDGSYRLNPGDVIQVSVWKEEDLEREVLVLPDGTISFPLAGHIEAAGKTALEIQDLISQNLERYIPAPVVTVSVLSVAGNKVYVLGEVNEPGEFQAVGRIDVMQALSLAGGLTPFASEDKIRVIRRSNGAEQAFAFHYSDVKKGRKLEMNIPLKSGDVIVVPGRSLF